MHAVSSPPPHVTPPLSWSRELSRAAIMLVAGLSLLLALAIIHVQQGTASLDAATIVQAIVAPDESTAHAVV
jgi:hypothetical protein